MEKVRYTVEMTYDLERMRTDPAMRKAVEEYDRIVLREPPHGFTLEYSKVERVES